MVTLAKKRQLRSEARRAKATKPIKRELICYVLHKNGPVMGRVEILKVVHALECSKIPFKPMSNHDYFTNVDPNTPQRPSWFSNPLERSVIFKGLVSIVWASGKRKKIVGYELTAEGLKLAEETEKKFFSGVTS